MVLAPDAVADLRRGSGRPRTGMETHLRHQPTAVSRSRIKRLRGLARPQCRLRVDDVRVFYDVDGRTVSVLAVVSKSGAVDWLAQHGVPS
ncbi:MAG: type II toxin-antitoxin system RelE/ParE family toxin [Deltaproteobacteria bacterium]|nr:type II toxin-antitoxin system RelE/ParE family toxin [Deltaproteobacteria bacterium]